MYQFVLIGCLFGYVLPTPTLRAAEETRIVGGEAIDISDAPYQVSILYRGRHSCGGTIIDHDLVLTAAHCIFSSNPRDYQIRAGSSSNTKGGEVYPVGDIIAHPDFSYTKMESDVALVWLSKSVTFGKSTAAVEMMDEDDEIEDGMITIVTGWGVVKENGGFPQTLQKVEVPKVNAHDCKEAYAPLYAITSTMLCAGTPEGGKDACQGDSGGPLIYHGKVAGVVSWGLGCARPDYPGVYAKVSALRTWLDDNILYLRLKHNNIIRLLMNNH